MSIDRGWLAGERLYGMKVEDQGWRLYMMYGPNRAYEMCCVFVTTAVASTQKAYWALVREWVCVNVKDSGNIIDPPTYKGRGKRGKKVKNENGNEIKYDGSARTETGTHYN